MDIREITPNRSQIVLENFDEAELISLHGLNIFGCARLIVRASKADAKNEWPITVDASPSKLARIAERLESHADVVRSYAGNDRDVFAQFELSSLHHASQLIRSFQENSQNA